MTFVCERTSKSKIKQIISYICQKRKPKKTNAISQKITAILAQTPIEQQERLREELLKMLPQAGSEVKLKIGNGIYPEDNESSMGIFVEVHHAQKVVENYDLLAIWQIILSHTKDEYLKELEKMLDFFYKRRCSALSVGFYADNIHT